MANPPPPKRLRLVIATRPSIYISNIKLHDSNGSLIKDFGSPIASNRHIPSTSAAPAAARARRGVAASRTDNANSSSNAPGRSLRLTVKAAPSRLRQVTNSSSPGGADMRERLGRNSKNKRPIVEESSEDDDAEDNAEAYDDDDDDEEEEGEGDSEEEEEDDAVDEEDEDEDAEADSEDADEEDEDVDMEDAPAPTRPKITISAPSANRKPSPRQALKKGNIKSVEDKQIQQAGTGMSSDNEELSELESADEDMDNEGEDQDENDEEDDEDDGDLEDERGDIIAADAIGEDELGSSDDGGEGMSELNSRDGTPDLSKLTRRQRAHFEDIDGSLMALSNEAQKKKFFTADEITMRRAEMARRRKDLSEKRNEEEKKDTLNRLLHKPAPKRRSRKEVMEQRERDEFGTPALVEGDVDYIKANKLYARTVMSREGTRVAVPEEWLGMNVGKAFESAKKDDGGKSLPVGKLIEVAD